MIVIDWEDFFEDHQVDKIKKASERAGLPAEVYIHTSFSEYMKKADNPPKAERRVGSENTEEIGIGDSFKKLDLKTRAENALDEKTDVDTIEDLLHWTEEDLRGIKRFGDVSFDSVEEELRKHGWEVGELHGEDDGNLIPTDEDNHNEEDDDNYPTTEVADQIEELTPSKSNLMTAVEMWTNATDRSKKEAQKVMKAEGFDPGNTETYGQGFQALINTLPIQDSQINRIYNAAEKLNQPSSYADDMANASFSRPLKHLNYQEAEYIYKELVKEHKDNQKETGKKSEEETGKKSEEETDKKAASVSGGNSIEENWFND